MASERPLLLHISALSPDEYESYTAVLAELAGPGHGESQWNKSVGVMEARGWLRGRYGLDAVLVDKASRFDRLNTVPDLIFKYRYYDISSQAWASRKPSRPVNFSQ